MKSPYALFGYRAFVEGAPPVTSPYRTSKTIARLVVAEIPKAGERTVLIDSRAMDQLGLTPDPRNMANIEPLTSPGHQQGPIGPWITYRDGNRKLHVGIVPWILARPGDHPLLATTRPESQWTEDRVAGWTLPRMRAWQDLTGSIYRGFPGVAGTALLRDIWAPRKDQPLWHHHVPIIASEPELTWRAPRVDLADPNAKAILVDSNRAYLAAASVVEVAKGRLDRGRGISFDPSRPGWWLVEASAWIHGRDLPDPLRRPEMDRPVWVTTPTLKLWDRLCQDPAIAAGYRVLDSWTAPKGARVFRTWAERLEAAWVYAAKDAGARGMPVSEHPLGNTVKGAYRAAIGLLNHEGALIERADWHYTLIAQHIATLWWKLWRAGQATGCWPESIATDSATYWAGCPASPMPAPIDHLVLGERLGQFSLKPAARKARR